MKVVASIEGRPVARRESVLVERPCKITRLVAPPDECSSLHLTALGIETWHSLSIEIGLIGGFKIAGGKFHRSCPRTNLLSRPLALMLTGSLVQPRGGPFAEQGWQGFFEVHGCTGSHNHVVYLPLSFFSGSA